MPQSRSAHGDPDDDTIIVQIDTGIKIDVSIIQWIKATALSSIFKPIVDGAGC